MLVIPGVCHHLGHLGFGDLEGKDSADALTLGMYLEHDPCGGGSVEAEELLADGASEAEVADQLGLKLNTLQKAIRAGRIRLPVKKNFWR